MKYYLMFALVTILNSACSSQSLKEEKANLLSVIKLPEDIYPTETLDEWYPNGDGYFLTRFVLRQDTIKNVKNQIKKLEGFKRLPFGDEIIDNTIYDYIGDGDEGYYHLVFNKNDPRDIKMVILDETKKELIFFISYQ